MLRLSKLTDYAIVIMAFLASNSYQKANNAKDIAKNTGISLPTISKLLKCLTQHKLLLAHRGMKGGYQLAYPATDISLTQIIQALEGQIALTECSHHNRRCAVEKHCVIRDNWRRISAFMQHTLNRISVADLLQPLQLEALLAQPLAEEKP